MNVASQSHTKVTGAQDSRGDSGVDSQDRRRQRRDSQGDGWGLPGDSRAGTHAWCASTPRLWEQMRRGGPARKLKSCVAGLPPAWVCRFSGLDLPCQHFPYGLMGALESKNVNSREAPRNCLIVCNIFSVQLYSLYHI